VDGAEHPGSIGPMKKLVILALLVAVGLIAAKRLRVD
jgi:hypothetical protein